MARWIQTNGTDTPVQPINGEVFTLKEMNTFVGGYLEAIRLNNQDIIYINEQGMLLQLPINYLATEILRQTRPDAHWDTVIVGDVFIAKLKETGDNEEEEDEVPDREGC